MYRFRLFGVLGCLLAASSAAQTPSPTTLTLTADASAPTVRQLLHLSATLSGSANATGTVTFTDGAIVIATVPLNTQGPTYLGVASLTQGSHVLTAAYSGDAANAASSASLALSVNGLPATITASASPTSLYANSSTTLTALGLPVDATGSVAFSDGASTLANVAISGTSTPNYRAFGDSITAGVSVADPTQHYVNEVATSSGFAFTNAAAAGAIACDLLPFQMLANGIGPTQASSPLSSVMIGTNDLDLHTAPPYEPLFQQCHQAALAWLAIPREYKILPTDTEVSILSGSWTASGNFDLTTYGTLFNSSGSDTARFSITTTGAPIYLWYLLSDQLSGSFTISVDGLPTGQSYSTQPSTPINSANSPSIAYALLRLPISQGPHTVDVITQSGSMGILAVATPPSPGLASVHPTVLATDIPSQLGTDPMAPTATIAAYTQDIQNDIALLAGDGLDIRFVPTQAFMQGLPAEMSDQINPNALGQAHLAQAFASVLANVAATPFAAFSNTAPRAIASFANPGSHTVTASYSGDNIYAPTTAMVSVNIIAQNATPITLATPATHSYFGPTVVLTATVSPLNATGTVTFYDGLQMIAQIPVTGGTSLLTSSNLAVGIHTLIAIYSGDAANTTSASPPLVLEIEPTPTILTLAALPAVAIYSPVTTLTASVAPISATGTVTFFDGSVSLGQVTVTNALATINTNLAVGTHTLSAQYSGDTNDLATSTAAQTITIQPIATSIALAPLPATAAYGSVLTLAATVLPAASAGTISFIDNVSGSVAQIQLTNGVANVSINTLTLGSHTITAIYAGDTTHAQSSSQPATTQIVSAPTTTTLAILPATINAGTSLTLSAQVSPASATGFVLFCDAAKGTLGQAPVVRGVATLTLNSLTAASYNVTAQYSGDSIDAPSTSAALTTQVHLVPTTTTLNQPATALYATPVTLTASVVPITASGAIQFSDANGLLATTLIANGVATAQIAALGTGSHMIRAAYLGDALNAASTSAPGTTLITADPTATAITLGQTKVPAGGLVIFNIAVTNSLGANPTGAVTLRSASTVLAQAQLTNASNGTAYVTISISASLLGDATATASYTGDTNNLASTSLPVTYTVIATPTVATLSLSFTSVPLQTPVTLSAIVASANAVPAGSVVFASNGVTLATVPLNSIGQASTILASLPLGAYAISATFVPTGFYASSSASAQTLTVTMPVALTVTPTSLSATPGSSQSATLTITPLSNFNGAIATQCQSSAPWLACEIMAPGSVNATPINVPIRIALKSSTAAAIFPILTLLLGPLVFKRHRRRLLPLLLTGAMLTLTACAEGGNFFNLPNGPQQLTLAVTADGVTITIPLTVNVSQ